jgi:hypothetical protein
VDDGAQHGPLAEAAGVQVRPEDRLAPRSAAILRHDRGECVDELGQTADLDAVGMAKQSEKHSADDKRVLKIVMLFQQRRGFLPGRDLLVVLGGVIPHVPLVKGQVHVFAGALFGLNIVADGKHGVNELVHAKRLRQIVELPHFW